MSPEQKVKIALQCILVLTLVALCILSFNSLFKADTSLSFKQDNNAYFPSLAICPTFSDHTSMKIESFDAVPNVSIRDFLNISIMKFDEDDWNTTIITDEKALSQIIFPYTHNAKVILLYNCTIVDLSLHSSVLKAGSYLAYLNVQFLPNDYFKTFSIIFHEKGNFDYWKSRDGSTFFANNVNGQRTYLELHMKKLINLESSKSPCSPKTIEKDGHDKLSVNYLSELNCTLPWLVGKKQLCQSQKDFNEFRSLALMNVDFKIAKKCERNVWKFTTLYSHRYDDFNGTMVTLMMPSDEVEIHEEVRLYTMANLIADFGGYLGLLLGASVMSLIDLVLDFWSKYRNKN